MMQGLDFNEFISSPRSLLLKFVFTMILNIFIMVPMVVSLSSKAFNTQLGYSFSALLQYYWWI